jgi:hypothetical protein
MRVSEKTLELNIGAELLWLFRNRWGMPNAYLRGLTQAEERREGFDFAASLGPSAILFAFQFKAPVDDVERVPYRYRLKRTQHDPLRQLAQSCPFAVFYVFPFYTTVTKVRHRVPDLLGDTWFLRVAAMSSATLFQTYATRLVSCTPGMARVNPAFEVTKAEALNVSHSAGIPVKQFQKWYSGPRDSTMEVSPRTEKPQRFRGLKLVIVDPG